MCGIFAVYQPCTCGGNVDRTKAKELSSRQSHRGPDYHGFYQHPVTGSILCHERLAIMDLSCTQPIQGSQPDHQVIHNGEIYNHMKLRENELSTFHFRTTCDSEVLIYLYEKYANDLDYMCNLLDGVFGFGIIYGDQFMVARDPIGIKQLYYGRDADERYFFSSELKAIEEICGPFEVHPFPIGHYFTPASGFTQYYKPKWFNHELSVERDKNAIMQSLHDTLIEATHKRLMSDAPIGVLLSGGLDSSLISAIAARRLKEMGQEVKSFSIGLDENSPDLIAARKVAAFCGTEHHEIHFTFEEGIENIRRLIWHLESYDVTTIRSSTPMYFLSKKIRESNVKVVLSGEGADEIFGGYLYFHNAPSDEEFLKETIRRVQLLNRSDCLRADKSCMANSVEVRVPFLDKRFLEVAMLSAAELRRPRESGEFKTEKYILRKAFDHEAKPYIPAEILWRQKEQFSDGVGYGWIDQLSAFCSKTVTDSEMASAKETFPYNTPTTKEAYYIRKIFHEHFPSEAAAKTVDLWIPKWQKSLDPSGRASQKHNKTICSSNGNTGDL